MIKKQQPISFYIDGILSGNISVLSRAITLIESTRQDHQHLALQVIDAILPFTGKSIRIGITGVPGVGKSTFIESFGMHILELGKKVAVLAIDPSSSLSRGSILGDKTRMEKLAVAPGAFIRPTASGGSLGGLAYKTREVTLLCEAAGFDHIIIETVGVGQSETEVSHITDFFLLLMLTGAGDELQGIKRGIMEMADSMVITKADGANLAKAKLARSEYARALHFIPAQASGWRPEVLLASSYENYGIAEVYQTIQKYIFQSRAKGFFEEKRKEQNLYAFNHLLQEKMKEYFLERLQMKSQIEQLKKSIIEGELSPYSAIHNIRWDE